MKSVKESKQGLRRAPNPLFFLFSCITTYMLPMLLWEGVCAIQSISKYIIIIVKQRMSYHYYYLYWVSQSNDDVRHRGVAKITGVCKSTHWQCTGNTMNCNTNVGCQDAWKRHWVWTHRTEQRADKVGGKTAFSPKRPRQKSSSLPKSNQIKSAVRCSDA